MGREQDVVRKAGSESKSPADSSVENVLDSLTPRQKEVLGMMARGFSNKTIGDRLVVVKGSVETHINKILPKIGVSSNDPEADARVKSVLIFQRNTPDFKNPVEAYFGDNEVTPLSPRQKEVVGLIGEGYTNQAIARRLMISSKAVENHINHILNEKIPVDPQRYDSRIVIALIAQTRHVAQ